MTYTAEIQAVLNLSVGCNLPEQPVNQFETGEWVGYVGYTPSCNHDSLTGTPVEDDRLSRFEPLLVIQDEDGQWFAYAGVPTDSITNNQTVLPENLDFSILPTAITVSPFVRVVEIPTQEFVTIESQVETAIRDTFLGAPAYIVFNGTNFELQTIDQYF